MIVIKIYKAFKFRMYPTKEQKYKLNSFLGSSRFIYNNYLSKKEQMYKEENKTYLLKDMKKDLVKLQEEYPWLKEVDGCILRTSLDDLDRDLNASINIMNKGIDMYIKEQYGN